jgi:inner membrane protein involved in colicin E2 resistance
LVSGAPIGVEMPQLLNPGPLASKVTFFAPLSLLFFFFVVAVLAAAQKKELHPLHYFFLGTAFFAFHLLFAYLVDHFAIVPSFVISSLVAVALVVSYSRLFVGWKFALREMAASQLIYLVLFSLTFFWNGFTGLSITVGAIITLAVLMQLTGRKNPFARDPDELEEEAKPACAAPYRCGVFPNATPSR